MPSPDEIMRALVVLFFQRASRSLAMIAKRQALVNALHLAAIQYGALADATPDPRLATQFARQAQEVGRLADEAQVAVAIHLED